MDYFIKPNKTSLKEALDLSTELLRNIELSEISLTNIALKASRLSRLLNDLDYQKIMGYEAGGYPSGSEGIPPDVWRLTEIADRVFENKVSGKISKYAYTESIGELEQNLKIAETALSAAKDPDVSISSSNPYQQVFTPVGNFFERSTIKQSMVQASKRLSSRRSIIYSYVLRRHYELKYSSLADDIFLRTRDRVDKSIGEIVPDAVQKLSSVYDNLISENPEDWSNAVHSCRRILQDLSDSIYPPSKDKETVVNGDKKIIKLGKDNYVNRIIAFIEEKSGSEKYENIVGSHLRFIGDRIDSIFEAAQKGSHHKVTREEADRYVIYTYLLIGDILSLK